MQRFTQRFCLIVAASLALTACHNTRSQSGAGDPGNVEGDQPAPLVWQDGDENTDAKVITPEMVERDNAERNVEVKVNKATTPETADQPAVDVTVNESAEADAQPLVDVEGNESPEGTAAESVEAESTVDEQSEAQDGSTQDDSTIEVQPTKEESTQEQEREVVETVPAGDETILLGRRFFTEGDLRNARAAFTLALSNDLSWEEEKEALDTLELINVQLLSSTAPEGDLIEYRVKSGDTLSRIAKAYTTTWQMIQRLNGLDSQTIRVGQRLYVPRAPLSLVVRKGKFVADLMIDGEFIKRYDVGLGVNDSTPLGHFTVSNRIPKPADGSYSYGHPKHRLGTHWLGLVGANGYEGYGIHGCRVDEYDLLGGECSRGCVRLTNEDVEELFSILPIGTKVEVIE